MNNLWISKCWGLVTINYYVEDRGDKTITRFKHFLTITIMHFWSIRCTFRGQHVYPLYFNDQEYLPKLQQ